VALSGHEAQIQYLQAKHGNDRSLAMNFTIPNNVLSLADEVIE
jgi:hypothetical protein